MLIFKNSSVTIDSTPTTEGEEGTLSATVTIVGGGNPEGAIAFSAVPPSGGLVSLGNGTISAGSASVLHTPDEPGDWDYTAQFAPKYPYVRGSSGLLTATIADGGGGALTATFLRSATIPGTVANSTIGAVMNDCRHGGNFYATQTSGSIAKFFTGTSDLLTVGTVATTASGITTSTLSMLSISADGTKAIVATTGSNLISFNLSTPFDLTVRTGAQTAAGLGGSFNRGYVSADGLTFWNHETLVSNPRLRRVGLPSPFVGVGFTVVAGVGIFAPGEGSISVSGLIVSPDESELLVGLSDNFSGASWRLDHYVFGTPGDPSTIAYSSTLLDLGPPSGANTNWHRQNALGISSDYSILYILNPAAPAALSAYTLSRPLST